MRNLLLVVLTYLVLSYTNMFAESIKFIDSGIALLNQDETEEYNIIGNGNYITKTYRLPVISSFTLESVNNVEIFFSRDCRVEIDADENILEIMDVSAPDGNLSIQSNDSYTTSNDIVFRIYTSTLSEIYMHGSGDIRVNDLVIKSLYLSMTGVGNISITGRTESLIIQSDGAGNIDCSNFDSNNVEITLGGVGDIDVIAKKHLKIVHDGSGIINYWGNPETEIQHEGVGEIIGN